MTAHIRHLSLVLRAAIIAAMTLPPALVSAQPAQPLTMHQIMADPDWIGGGVEQAWWSWDGTQALYLRKRDGATIRDEARVFLDILEQHYGQRPLIYTTVDFFEDTELWRLQGVEFWLRSVADHPHGVYDGTAWSFWQYTSTGLIPGVQGKVDINVFAGSKAAWADWLARRGL